MKDYNDLLDAIDETYEDESLSDGAIVSGTLELSREDFLDEYGEDSLAWNEFQGDTLVIEWSVDHPTSEDPRYNIDSIWSDLMKCHIVKPSDQLEEYILEQVKSDFEFLNRWWM